MIDISNGYHLIIQIKPGVDDSWIDHNGNTIGQLGFTTGTPKAVVVDGVNMGSAASNAGRTIFVTCTSQSASLITLGSGANDIIGNGFGTTNLFNLGTGAETLRHGYFVSSNGTNWVVIGT